MVMWSVQAAEFVLMNDHAEQTDDIVNFNGRR